MPQLNILLIQPHHVRIFVVTMSIVTVGRVFQRVRFRKTAFCNRSTFPGKQGLDHTFLFQHFFFRLG